MGRYDAFVEVAQQVVRGAGAVVREAARQGVTIEHKSAIDLVTSADKASEAFIVDQLRSHFPDHGFLAEESGAQASSSDYRWVIDPIDGTSNFAHGILHYCILLGLQERRGDTFETVVGVTFDPVRDELFWAARGVGAFLNDRRIAVSKTTRLIDGVFATGFSYDRLTAERDNHAEFCRINLISRGVRRMGSAGLDLAYVACGRMDGFWEYHLNAWDLVPGILLVQEAGGVVEDLEGGPAIPGKGAVVASGPLIYEALRAALLSAREVPVNSRSGLKEHLPAK